MRIIRHAEPAAWLNDCAAELEREEVLNSLILGAAMSGYGSGPAPYLSVVRDGAGRLRLAALMIAPERLVVAGDAGAEDEALRALAGDLSAPVGTLNAPDPLAERLAAVLGEGWSVAMRQRLHALHRVAPVPRPPGRLRLAEAADQSRVAAWIAAFERDALGTSDARSAAAQAERRIARGEMVLWDDGRVRCMAARARRTRRTETVNHVYTPPEHRGRGYATALVAALSERLLAEGCRECVLFTDLANPTSNAIYARIGYRPVGDFSMIRL